MNKYYSFMKDNILLIAMSFIYIVLGNAVTTKFFYVYQMPINISERLLDIVTGVETWAIQIVPVLLLFTIIFKNFKTHLFPLVLVLGYYSAEYGLYYNYIHNFLLNYNLYPSILSRNPAGGLFVNNQYSLIFPYFILVLINFIFVIRKKTRNLARIYSLLIAGACIVTTLIFHFIVVQSALHSSTDETRRVRLDIAENLISLDRENWQDYCIDYFNCLELEKGIYINSKSFTPAFEEIIGRINDLHSKSFVSGNSDLFIESKLEKQQFLSRDVRSNIYSYRKMNSNYSRVIFDEKPVSTVIYYHSIWYSLLIIFAHSVWIFGGMYLLWFHQYYKKVK